MCVWWISPVERHYLAHYPRDPRNPHAKPFGGSITNRTQAAPLTQEQHYAHANSDYSSSSGGSSSSSSSSSRSNFGQTAVSWADRLKNRELDFGAWEVGRFYSSPFLKKDINYPPSDPFLSPTINADCAQHGVRSAHRLVLGRHRHQLLPPSPRPGTSR